MQQWRPLVSQQTLSQISHLPYAFSIHQEGTDCTMENSHAAFIQTVSHELRTPLSIAQGYAELLQAGDMGGLNPSQQQAIAIITKRMYQLHTIIEQIGILLSIEANEAIVLPVSLTEIATQAIETYKKPARQANLGLETSLSPDVPITSGNPHHLKQAAENLIDNAIKFTPAGGQVEIKTYTEPDWLCFAVCDTGIGIPKEKLDHIFTSFYQIDNSSTRKYGGLGIGLTVARAIAEDHAGWIDVESKPGVGSTFTLRIPTPRSESNWQNDLTSHRILVVDDEEVIALGLKSGLEALPDCDVSIETDPKKALAHFQEQPFDLLITDYQMPRIDGVTLAKRVRELSPETNIILLTAYADDELIRQAERLAIEHVLDKPAQLDKIRRTVLLVLNQCETPKTYQAGG